LFLMIIFVTLPLLALNGCTGLADGKAPQPTASLAISPTSLNFGKVTAGQKSTQTVKIANTGTTAVTIQQATISDPQWGISGVTLPTTLAAGQSKSFTVWMKGATAGSVSGTLAVQADPGTSPFVLGLSGTVTTTSQSHGTVAPAAIDFGTASIGSKDGSTLTVGNSGASDLVISVITLKGSEFGVSGITTPRTLSAGQSLPINVSFSPTVTGVVNGSIAFTTNDPTNPNLTVPLAGTGSTASF
jgi:hypothetical protein